MTGRVAPALRALPALLRVGFADAVAYRAEMLVWLMAYTTPLIMLALWTAVARDGAVSGFDARKFQAYFLITLVVRVATGSWVVWEMNFEIRQGGLAKRLLRPIHPLLTYATENIAALPMRFVLVTPIALATVWWLGSGIIVRDPVQLAIVPLSLMGAWALWFCSMAIIGTLGLFFESSMSVFEAWLGFNFVLSGYVVPLALYPQGVQDAIAWLPFPYVLSFPVSNVLGSIDRAAALHMLGAQWTHVGLHLTLLLLMWNAGVKRFQAYGG